MTFLIIFAAIVCVVGLVITLLVTKQEDTSYSQKKSISNQLILYIILIPVIAIITIATFWLLS
ncbi:BshB3 potential contributor to bacillithiol synthesis [Alkalihalobacillus sp. 1P02AB]|uniref:BshB3 potential contributor to bacillithiol synthesis n=1 Tax=Alkalihalobacillus sp. 1P02AB TaxID=3132260 RepID=UPI0039A4FEEA